MNLQKIVINRKHKILNMIEELYPEVDFSNVCFCTNPLTERYILQGIAIIEKVPTAFAFNLFVNCSDKYFNYILKDYKVDFEKQIDSIIKTN